MAQGDVGIYASQISGHLWAPNGAFDALATTTLSSATSSVTFAGIPQGYKHLQIRVIGRTTNSEVNLAIKFNSDGGNNYDGHYLYGDGGTAGAGVLAVPTGPPFVGRISPSSAGANVFGSAVIDILDYASTDKNKTVRSLSGYDNNGSGSVFFISNLWMNTSAISSIEISVTGTNSLAQYSQFALYGVK